MLRREPSIIEQVHTNAGYFREKMNALGFSLAGADHPIIPVMLGDAKLAGEFAQKMGERGIFVTAFSFPVVPRDAARVRVQMSAAHTPEHVEQALAAFARAGRALGVIE